MPELFTQTDTEVTATIGSATLVGRRWTSKPPYVSPLDETPQADLYRAAIAGMSHSVDVWRAVRYGEPPVGDLRFKPCVAYSYPAGTHQCVTPASPAVQTYAEERGTNGRPGLYGSGAGTYGWPARGVVETEDAPHLTVIAPITPGPHPVWVFTRGGGWTSGDSEMPQQWAMTLAALFNVVVVLPEYRHSVFGHFPLPGIAVSGEPSPAYTDFKEAVRWTHTNIGQFRGDTTAIGAFGTSAGGAQVLLLQEDDDADGWLAVAWADSGGGSAPYLTEAFWGPRVERFRNTVRGAAPFLLSQHPDYKWVQDAFDDGRSDAWVWQHALSVGHVQAMADIGPIVTAASVGAVVAGSGDLVAGVRTESENFYPFRRGSYANAIEMAKAGKIGVPMIFSYAECEALNLFGSDYVTVRNTLLALPTSTLDGWAQRLGYANYAAWKAADWIATHAAPDPSEPWQTGPDLENLSSAQFRRIYDPAAIDCENRRVLYTHAVFGYPAWRMARAVVENGGTAYLVLNNFSANSIWAGHSQMVPLCAGTVEWNVGGVVNHPTASPPGEYANVRMDILFLALGLVMPKMARFAATGDPEGAYSAGDGFTIFAGNAPADGGSLAGTWVPYSLLSPGHHNVVGKYFDPYDNLNGAQFFPGTGTLDLALQRDARTTHVAYMTDAFMEYLSLLEP